MPTSVRSSRRLQGLPPAMTNPSDAPVAPEPEQPTGKSSQPKPPKKKGPLRNVTLPRTREEALLRTNPRLSFVIGVDEAGRGPLAGPVVAAAVYLPHHIDGIVDSKAVTCEHERRKLYQKIVDCDDCYWAVAVVDAATIDEINILQATLLGMRSALHGLCDSTAPLPTLSKISIDHPGSYMVVSSQGKRLPSNSCCAIIDGNQLPKDLPCLAETMIKGDGREYAVAAASLLAKVTRDELCCAYERRYPWYGFARHKGYPTAAHVTALRTYGPTFIHRKTFGPVRQLCHTETRKHSSSKKKRKVGNAA